MTKTLSLRSLDIPAIHRFGIGFDNMFDELLRVSAQQGNNNYPPYNIVQVNENQYIISVAVAGFALENLSVTKDKKVLIIEGTQSVANMADHDEAGHNYLHKGISERNFRREFQLADHVEITGAHLELGILNVQLQREVPESAKPKSIAITYQN